MDAAHPDTAIFFKSIETTGKVSSISQEALVLASNAAVVIAAYIPVALWAALLSSMVSATTSIISINADDKSLNRGVLLYGETAEEQVGTYGDLIRSI